MKKYLFVIADYKDERQEFFDTYTSPRNKEYCYRHGWEYLLAGKDHYSKNKPFRGIHTWDKYKIVLDMIDNGTLKMGDYLTHIDADTCWVDGRVPLQTNKDYTVTIDSGNSWCAGVYAMKITDWTYQFLKNVLCDYRFNRLKDKATLGSMGEQSSYWEIFREQASISSLFGVKRHSWESFLLLPHFGAHSDYNEDTVYSLEDFYKHIEVLGPPWNTTIIPTKDEDGDHKHMFYINPSKKEYVILRHWAGRTNWDKSYFERKML